MDSQVVAIETKSTGFHDSKARSKAGLPQTDHAAALAGKSLTRGMVQCPGAPRSVLGVQTEEIMVRRFCSSRAEGVAADWSPQHRD